MRGRYRMCHWEIEKWKEEFYCILENLKYNKTYEAILTNYNLCPANVCKVLEEMSWTEVNMDSNGWEHDTWYTFHNSNYDFNIVFYYEGYTFEMSIYREDRDD